MNLQGDFEGSFLTNILQLLCDDQNTGILQVTCGRKICKVFLKEGSIAYAQSSESQARLGEMLQRDGIISASQLKDSLATAMQNRNAIGKVLLEKGYISLDIFKEYNTRQVEDILYSILFWEKGKFSYQDAPLLFDRMIVTSLNPMKLILEASRRIDEMSLLTDRIKSDQQVYRRVSPTKGKEGQIPLSVEEKRILALTNGENSVRGIIRESRDDEFTVYKGLYSLLTSGIIEKVEAAAHGFDLDAAIAVYTEILAKISIVLGNATGERTNVLVHQAKDQLPPAQKQLLQDFQLSSAPEVNRKAVLAASRKSGRSRMQQSLLLIDSLNGLCHHLLRKTIPLVDQQKVYDLIRKIDKSLEGINALPGDWMEKNKMMSDMKQVLNDAMKQVKFTPAKPKNQGILSLFRKK